MTNVQNSSHQRHINCYHPILLQLLVCSIVLMVAYSSFDNHYTITYVDAWVNHVQPSHSTCHVPWIQPRTNGIILGATSGKSGSSGGFGTSNNNNKKDIKLKPKQQWDRYIALKKEVPRKVGVKVTISKSDGTIDTKALDDPTNDNNWLEVGSVKSQSDIPIDIAVAKQRALIVEHAKRLYPLQISNKVQVEWGYYNVETNEWMIVDKSILNDTNNVSGTNDMNIEKLIGFEGIPDPTTGYYCVYNEGRLVKSTDGASQPRPSSKKLG